MYASEALLKELCNTHRKINYLIESLSDEELQMPYHPWVNPPLWELGHASYFFEFFILCRDGADAFYEPRLNDIWDSFCIDHKLRWQPGLLPSKEAILTYVATIYEKITARIKEREPNHEELYLYNYALFHQNMHIESLLYARQTIGYRAVHFCDKPLDKGNPSPATGDTHIPAGTYSIGVTDGNFGFDNEKPAFDIELDAFTISKTLVTNGDFMRFIEGGGYCNRELWSWGGKIWLDRTEAAAPCHWHAEGQNWQERCFGEHLEINPNYPVKHISYWEAEAYCNWAGRRLPSEFEWEAAALGNSPDRPRRSLPWGNQMGSDKVDMDCTHLAKLPVNAYENGQSPFGCRQMIGTVWEWTSSQFLPYDGFKVDMYPYMSTLQFGYHKVTRGGSCITSSNIIRGSYRQAYLPERNDVFVGFRTCAL